MRDYWFFTSHAGRDVDEYMKKFWNDLATEVASKAGLTPTRIGLNQEFDPAEIGFLDRTGIVTGNQWPLDVGDALQTSRALICLYSAAFFGSEYCGKELQFFLDRIGESETTSGRLPLVLPVLWEHPDTLPENLPFAVSQIQYVDDELGKNYRKYGLRYLIKLQQHADDYQKFVETFALRLVRIAELNKLKPLQHPPSLAEAQNAFELKAPMGEDTAKVENVGPNTAKFLFVARKKADLEESSEDIGRYGHSGGREWKPYFPEDVTVGMIAQEAAVLEKLFYESPAISESLIEDLQQAERTNTIVIIVVDPCSIMIGPYKHRMLEFDERNFVNCALLVPWNMTDGDPAQGSNPLQENVKQTLSRNFVNNSPFIREPIISSEELQKKLISTIHEVRKKIIQRAEVFNKIESEGSKPFPTVSGPKGGAALQ